MHGYKTQQEQIPEAERLLTQTGANAIPHLINQREYIEAFQKRMEQAGGTQAEIQKAKDSPTLALK